MKEYTTKDIRDVVLLGSTKSGKTTLAEAMLFEGKVIDRRGSVEDQNTVSDSDELEKQNQRTQSTRIPRSTSSTHRVRTTSSAEHTRASRSARAEFS